MSESLLVSWQTYLNIIGIGLLAFLVSALLIQFLPLPNMPGQTPTVIAIVATAGYLFTKWQKKEN
jgi:hypothetical protein